MWNKALQIVCFVGLLIGLGSCIDLGKDYDECVDIEEARCLLREACDDDFDRDYCNDYAGENCRARGIEGEFTGNELDACIEAILLVPCEDLDPAVDETDDITECDFIEGEEESEEESEE